jgi:hypothetical protein
VAEGVSPPFAVYRVRDARAEREALPVLVGDLADDLCALPAEAWSEQGSARADGPAALAERMARLRAGRASLRAEDEERPKPQLVKRRRR